MIQVTNAEGDGVTQVRIGGELDADSAPVVDKRLLSLIEDGSNRIAIDLSDLAYIASAGIRTLISAARMARIGSGDIVLCGLRDQVATVLAQSGLSQVIRTTETVDEAVAALSA